MHLRGRGFVFQEGRGKKNFLCLLIKIQLLSLSYDFTRAGYNNIHFPIAGPLPSIAILKAEVCTVASA